MTTTETPLTVIVGPSMESEQAASYLMAHWLLTDSQRNPITFRSAGPGERGITSVCEVLGRLAVQPAGGENDDGTGWCGGQQDY